MRKVLPIIVFAAFVVGSGVLHGIRTERWKPTQGLDEAVRRIDEVPMVVGDWQGEKQVLDANDLARAGIKGHLFCRYRNVRTGAVFTVLLVCGRTGPICVHTPDVCYEGAGYESVGSQEPRDVLVGERDVRKFIALRFRKPGQLSASQVEILWAWNGGDGWAGTDNPRLEFARYRVLYKMYVIREVSPREKADTSDPYADFMRSFIPQLDEALYPKNVS